MTTNILNRIKNVMEDVRSVLVHGDTSTTFVTALACFYMQIPVGHVEAWVTYTYNIYSLIQKSLIDKQFSIISSYNFV